MGGGLMQLVAYGAQDVYLTGKPQITFFKVVYRRHTNFAVEPIQQTFNGAAEFGRTVTCNINRNGDLITKMYLVSQLDKKTRTNWGWVRRLGLAMIESAKIEIGGAKIDEQYGDWINIWNELTRNTGLDSGYASMIGDVDELTSMSHNVSSTYTMYVPLTFWFNRNNGLALPLIALQYHDVRVTVKFREACHLVNYTNSSTLPTDVKNDLMKDCYLLIDYVYLDSEERKRFAQAAHEYLIEQLQFTGDETMNSSNVKYRLSFNHPSKYLIWATKKDRYTELSNWLAWAFDGDWDKARDDFAKKIWLATRAVLANDNSTFTLTLGDSTIELGENPVAATGLPTLVTAILGKIDAQILFDQAGTSGTSAAATTSNVVIIRNDLTMDDINHTVAELVALTTGGVIPTNGKAFLNNVKHSYNVRDYFNYSDAPNCYGNPVLTAKLQLNGHDRFQTRDGNYFNYVQPWQHWNNTPCDGVNSYSFALKPEEHQPSGTCNFSRIDNVTLNLTTTWTDSSDNGVIKIYCKNYNVLRIMSGMGGLAYSN